MPPNPILPNPFPFNNRLALNLDDPAPLIQNLAPYNNRIAINLNDLILTNINPTGPIHTNPYPNP
jgi:hypothetical protein